MKGYTKRKAIGGQKVRKMGVSIDAVTDAAVRALCTREGLSYSAALCALATDAAIRDPELMAAIKVVVAEKVHQTMKETGFHPGLSRELARELTIGYTQPHTDYPMPGLDDAERRRAQEKIEDV